MLRISVCDDSDVDRISIANNIKSYMSNHPEYDMKFDLYPSSVDILDSFEKIGVPDIALLDICMPGVLGTELASKIQSYNESIDIIFLTTSADYALDAFSLHVADYIQKPFTQERFDDSLTRVISSRLEKKWIVVSSDGIIYRIAFKDIIYVETYDKRRDFVLSSGKRLSTWLAASELKKSLMCNKSMVLCGASYIINMDHVCNILNTSLVMDNGETIPVPRRIRSQIKERFFEFYINKAKKL